MDSPCRYCERRELGCHASCKEYAEYDNARKQLREEQRESGMFKDAYATRYFERERLRKAAWNRFYRRRNSYGKRNN